MVNEFQITGLVELERDLNRTPEALEKALEDIAGDIRFAWKVQIIATGAVDTRSFLNSVGEHRVSAKEFLIDTSDDPFVTYSDIVERGRKDLPNYPDRHPAEKALNALDAQDFVGERARNAFNEIYNSSR